VRERVIDEAELQRIDERALARVDAAVAFADASPFPAPESLYDDVYVLEREASGWYSVQTTDTPTETPEQAAAGAANDEIPQQLTEALAAGEDGHEAPAEDGVSWDPDAETAR